MHIVIIMFIVVYNMLYIGYGKFGSKNNEWMEVNS